MKLSICQAFAEQSSSKLWCAGSLWGFAVGGILVAGTHTLVHPPSKSSNHPKLPCCASLLLLSFTSSCYEGGGFFLLLGRRWLVWRLRFLTTSNTLPAFSFWKVEHRPSLVFRVGSWYGVWFNGLCATSSSAAVLGSSSTEYIKGSLFSRRDLRSWMYYDGFKINDL